MRNASFARRWDGSAWVDATVRRWDGSAWVVVFPIAIPLSVSLNSTFAQSNFVNSPAANTPPDRLLTTSPNSVATPSGGTPGYTYSWTRISGSTAITAGSPTSASTSFSGTVPVNSVISAVFRVTVTDSVGATATADVTVSFAYDSGF